MPERFYSIAEKKRKHSQSEERHDSGKRRSTELSQEQDLKDELADAELDRIGSDIEEGGLDLSLPFQPITAYITDKREMLEQCFHVLGEKKLRKMLPDELKDCSLIEIKKLCLEQLEPISEKNLFQILAGEELTSGNGDENSLETLESQQDNNVDSTSCFKETAKPEYPKQDGGGSGEESDVLSINADTYDSDIEGPKEEQTVKDVARAVKVGDGTEEVADPACPEPPAGSQPVEAKKDFQSDIDKSVNEILAFSPTATEEMAKEQSVLQQPADDSLPVQEGLLPSRAPVVCQPSIQQLELLELEMRARAIKALMKASGGNNEHMGRL
ncbi:Caspase activity and apoptosis inhibitor 1 Conserved anti-apoptotic protein [Channa argus]|uniref:Caspase activity and apoptosis inhibitor 1 Conserved anti-apoptotic protein n=1 Tax=Channa argus TaxID=215402 RepID=A0A6G1Q5Q8_CHAAH|nr:Caspase activity and apoptosis inhibitor 1 Conserved anti-apoptotic protein [Channa argus]